ncbi:hypothetical protein [Mycoplasmopsis cynos]|uniref:HapA protein n=2 Tax=Mycoplasmopsis cynos TaxID=171284 RepID=A0ABD8AJX6_9BACT|nr:hypothetical protein [Mycoplasmopsis cynos]MCU9933173.1 hypothetical protein [Mycoplasmopsis cynos]MCU9935457.1 hypothetical protein [Mycoplasmopsis cynos]UWV80331.1 hypothetical protein NW069_03165 [Mycoplasmopsis cynos]WAM08903.1 hypothetical protein ONA03_00705 [Mycoplasmopsis cynos]WQQ19720.1 hypothetical protein RRG46_02625 [Mycoplasmopsis cynos]
MSKYKKIFSGLGLLSISTLVGASVVACANKKPKASDSSTEGIDQNNNQGNSTTPKDGENTPGNPTPEAPKTNPETSEEPKTETPKNPEMSKENPEQNDNTGQGNGSNSNKQEENKGEGGKDDSKQENKPTPEPQPKPEPKVTVEAKSMELLESIEKLPYPQKDAKAKQTLKSKVNEIKNKNEEENKKIEELGDLNQKLIQIKEALLKISKKIKDLPYPKSRETDQQLAKDYLESKLNTLISVEDINKVIPNDLENKIKKYNQILMKGFSLIENFPEKNKNGLNERLARLYGDDHEPKLTEGELIWQIYETIRQKAYVIKIKEIVKEVEKQKEFLENEDDVKEIPESMKMNPGINIDQLEKRVNKMSELIEKAKKANLNA